MITSVCPATGCGDSDAVLLRRYHAGDEEGATQLYHRYASRLRAFARLHCSFALAARLDPEDIVQVVFLYFFRQAARGKYQDNETQDYWKLLSVIALNHIRDAAEHHRAAKRSVCRTHTGSHEAFHESQPAHQEQQLNDLRLFINDLLEQLPAPQQEMVRLRLQGFEVAEIASQTGCSKRTVERGLHDFRQALQAEWGETVPGNSGD